MRGQAKISFAHARGVSGACPVRLFEKLEKVFLAKLGHQSRKRAERGWKSEAGPLSWKSGWKPSISRRFWAIGGYCIFFPFRDMAILKCPLGRIKFPMLKYGPVECLIWGMFQWAKQAFIGTVRRPLTFAFIRIIKNSDCNVYSFGFCVIVIVKNINILRASSSSRRAQIELLVLPRIIIS